MTALKIRKFGDEVAVVLDAESLRLLGAEVGDTLVLEQSEDRVVVSTLSAETSRQVEIARGVLERYRKTFEALAK